MGKRLEFQNDASLKEFFLRNSDIGDIVALESKYENECPSEIKGEFRQRLRRWSKYCDEKKPQSEARKMKVLVDLLDNLEDVECEDYVDDDVDNTKTIKTFKHYNFKGGEQQIINISKEIHEGLLSFSNQMQRVRYVDSLKEKVSDYFTGENWQGEHKFSGNRAWRMDFIKDQIGIEVELGNSREVCFRDFLRFMLLKERNIIKVGILIVYADSDSVAKRNTSACSQTDGKSNPYFTLNYMKDVLDEFGPVIDVPLLCIGI